MNSVIVTVKCKNKKDTRDLELPPIYRQSICHPW